MKGGGRGYIIYIRARNMCAQTEAGKRENRDSGYEEKKKTGEEGADREEKKDELTYHLPPTGYSSSREKEK